MRISDWSSDVCSSDLQRRTNLIPVIGADAGRRRKTLGSHVTDLAMEALEKETLRLFSCPTSGFDHPPMPLAHDQQAASDALEDARSECTVQIFPGAAGGRGIAVGINRHVRSDTSRVGKEGGNT